MQWDASLLVPSFRRAWDMVTAMPGTVAVAWLATAVIGVLTDVGIERSSGTGSGILLVYGIATTFVQVWITREALELSGAGPALSLGNWLSVYLQGLLVGLAIIFGLLLLVLPGLYLFARWYLASVVLIREGGGRRAAMGKSWDMLQARWPAALGIGLIMFVLSLAPIAADFAAPALPEQYGFGWIVGTNLVAAIGAVGAYLAAVALYLNIEQPASTLREIFG